MNRNKLAKKTAPLILVPLSYIGAVLIHGSHPPIHELLWTVIFIALVSLPVGYFGLYCIVLPIEQALKDKNHLSNIKLIILSSIGGGILFAGLSLLKPASGDMKILAMMLVFSMGFILGLGVTLSYCLISGTIKKSFLPFVFISIIAFFYLVSISPTIIRSGAEKYEHFSIKKVVSNAGIKELTLRQCYGGNCDFLYENLNEKVLLQVSGYSNSKSKTELINLIFSTWPEGASHCNYFYKGKNGNLPECSVN